jgi:hypothetical protein
VEPLTDDQDGLLQGVGAGRTEDEWLEDLLPERGSERGEACAWSTGAILHLFRAKPSLSKRLGKVTRVVAPHTALTRELDLLDQLQRLLLRRDVVPLEPVVHEPDLDTVVVEQGRRVGNTGEDALVGQRDALQPNNFLGLSRGATPLTTEQE